MSIRSSLIDQPLQIEIRKIFGNIECLLFDDLQSSLGEHTWSRELWISCHLCVNNHPLLPPLRTRFPNSNENEEFRWDETITFSIKYKDIPRNSELVFFVWNIKLPKVVVAVAVSVLPLFDNEGNLAQGEFKLFLKPLINRNDPKSTLLIHENSSSFIDFHFDPVHQLKRKFTFEELSNFVKISSLPPHLISKQKILQSLTFQCDDPDDIFLSIYLPEFDTNVVFYDKEYSPPLSAQKKYPKSYISKGLFLRPNRRLSNAQTVSEVFVLKDPDAGNSNPVADKHNKILNAKERDILIFDKNLKPTNEDNKKLSQIIQYPPTVHLTQEEQSLVWKFRGYLQNNKKALPKFLKCVDWSQPKQAKHAESLLRTWEHIGVDDALELLSYRFESQLIVRRYAVKCLKKASDEELIYYLLQLVQALRYERPDQDSPLLKFLIKRATTNFDIANYLYWFLKVEAIPQESNDYHFIFRKFLLKLVNDGNRKDFLEHLDKQTKFFTQISHLCTYLKSHNMAIPESEKYAEKFIQDKLLPRFQPFPLPLNPSITVTGILTKVRIFSSATKPLKLTFTTVNQSTISIMYKVGDDLRQDQLILQLISLMDRLLKRENLDLKLSPYRVLATSLTEGMVEIVPNASSVTDIIKKYNGNVGEFLRTHNPDPAGPFGIKETVFNTFVRSCAGYCVITYILGIGDRHLENILVTTSGHFFHIDFGYILGRDPKGLVSPIRITQEIVDVMGGEKSEYFNLFLSLCAEAYNILRKSSNLLLNLMLLMIHSNIPQLVGEKDLLEVEKRLNLDLSDEEAAYRIVSLICQSVNAIGPKIAELLHNISKRFRK